MYEGEIETSIAAALDAIAEKRVAAGLAFLNEMYPHWHQNLDVADIHLDNNRFCPAAHASGKRYQDFVAELQTKDPDTYTTQWFFDHAFYHHISLEERTSDGKPGLSPGYHILNETWRSAVSYDQVVQSSTG